MATCSLVIPLVVAGSLPPALAVDKPTVAVPAQNCVTAECHGPVKKFDVLHGPVNVGACDACHTLASAEQHTFTLARKPTELCTFCHVIDTETAKVVHEPVKTGHCLECHNPHGGFDRGFLRGRSMGEFCAKCHEDVTARKKHVHGPVAAGACSACHAPHTAEHDKLLLLTGRDLCLSCHQELGRQLEEVKFKHEAVESGCSQCHDPHASDFPMQVRAAPLELCTTACHQDVRAAVYDAKVKHSAVTKDHGCANCHTPHGGDMARLLLSEPVKMCLSCHKEPVKTDTGRVVAAVAEVTDAKLVKHGPVRDGMCGGCHDVHGSEFTKLLAKPYPAAFYAPFDPKNYELCFTCHDAQLVEVQRTEALTNFRNGDQSLHYVHVHKDKRGRTCRACHSTHASPNPVHVRESVPYGSWELPINFQQTATGGSCAPGCHQPLAYDRVNPIAPPAKEPTP